MSQQRGFTSTQQHSSSSRGLDQDSWGWGDAQADGQRGAYAFYYETECSLLESPD